MQDGNGPGTTVNLVAAGNFGAGQGDVSTMATGRGKGLPLKSIMLLQRRTNIGHR